MSDLAAFYDPTKTYDANFDDGPAAVAGRDAVFAEVGRPTASAFGTLVYTPFGIPAGPLLNSEYIKYAFARGFDVLTYKTQRSIAFQANQFPNVLYLDVEGDLTLEKAAQPLVGRPTTDKAITDLSITNSFGNPSRGPAFWVEDLKKALTYQGAGQLLIMSVVGTIQDGFTSEDYYNDFAEAAALAAQTGVQAIEINLSCPNVANEGILCYTRPAVLDIVQRVKARIGETPLIVKLGYYSQEQQELLGNIIADIAPYIAGVAAINTLSAAVVDDAGEQALPGPNRLKSGICGASIKWAGLDMVQRLAALRAEHGYAYEIIGVGGVMTPADYQEYRAAGADIVQSATGAMWNPQLAAQIKQTI